MSEIVTFLCFCLHWCRGERPCGAVCPTWTLARDLPVSPHERRPGPGPGLLRFLNKSRTVRSLTSSRLCVFVCSHPQVPALVSWRCVQEGGTETDRKAGPGRRVSGGAVKTLLHRAGFNCPSSAESRGITSILEDSALVQLSVPIQEVVCPSWVWRSGWWMGGVAHFMQETGPAVKGELNQANVCSQVLGSTDR